MGFQQDPLQRPYNIDFVGKFVKKKMEDIVLSF